MKKLSDYKGDEAIELWADLIEPLSKIFRNADFMRSLKGKGSLLIAKEILKQYKTEATEILLRIDPTPIDGMNVLMRLVALLQDVKDSKEIMVFFGSVEQEMTVSASSGSPTDVMEDDLK